MNDRLVSTSIAAILVVEVTAGLQSHRTIKAEFLQPEMPIGGVRGIGSTSKKNLTLDLVLQEKTTTRGPNQSVVRLGSKEQRRLGIDPIDPDPPITATIEMNPHTSIDVIQRAKLAIVSQIGSFITVHGPLRSVADLARDSDVKRVDLVAKCHPSGLRPGPKKPKPSHIYSEKPALYSGRGVAIAVLDTGIDWKHQDFIKRDGSTRILALYDYEDQSWRNSHGKIGSKPPLSDENGPIGTVYTADQINLALRGKGKIGSRDKVGHGTAVAGVACGNGFAARAKFASYQGVAPDASLIVVRAGNEEMTPLWAPFAQWAKTIASAHHMPVVVNISAGSQYTEHDGTLSEESELDELMRANPRGFAVVVAAGNEGEDQIVASGRFHSRRAGLNAFEGKDIEITSRPTESDCVPPLICYFKRQDDWGLLITGNQAPFTDDGGNQITMQITKVGDKPMAAFHSKVEIEPILKQKLARSVLLTQTDSGDDSLMLPLPAGTYTVTAFGSGPVVRDGRFMFSLPMGDSSFFSMGSTSRCTISSPGNASGVITVGSYNNRNSLQSKAGVFQLNNELGAIADYSSRGYRRDGWIKPDLVGPGSLQISSLADGSDIQQEAIAGGGYEIALSGKHTIWQGTSAAAPYVSGVIALMLQKNPDLGSKQISQILKKSAKIDRFTGAVPNPDWGFGKVDLEHALAATPFRKRRRK